MNFNIISIKHLPPVEGKKYLFDSNVWKYVLLAPQHPTQFEKSYIDFFDAVINLSTNPQCRNRPMIYVNGLIFSEVYNAFIKSCLDAFNNSSSTPPIRIKDYRSTNDFKKNHNAIKSDFRAYEQCLIIDQDLRHSPEKILQQTPDFSDYNDHYYFSISQSMGLSIVTNDADFKYKGVEIITMNDKLLKLR